MGRAKRTIITEDVFPEPGLELVLPLTQIDPITKHYMHALLNPEPNRRPTAAAAQHDMPSSRSWDPGAVHGLALNRATASNREHRRSSALFLVGGAISLIGALLISHSSRILSEWSFFSGP